MKNILLFLLSLVVYQIRSADFEGSVTVGLSSRWDMILARGCAVHVKRSDTIGQVMEKFYDGRNSCNRIHLQPYLGLLSSWEETGLPDEQTIDESKLLELDFNHKIIYIKCPLIDVTCRTMTGKSFKVEWPLFGTAREFGNKVVNEILDVQDGYTVKFIHKRAGKLSDAICADQVAGLLEDPNLTVVVEPI